MQFFFVVAVTRKKKKTGSEFWRQVKVGSSEVVPK
jgi:hypothetical protein